MPIDIGDNYNLVNDLLSKNNGVFISPKEYERYANNASYSMFDDFAGIKTNPKVTYGKNRLVDGRLNPFRRRVSLTFTGGVATKPANLKAITAIYVTGTNEPVRPTDEDRRAMLFQDPLAMPNNNNVYYIEGSTELYLLGRESLIVTIEYLERPTAVVYGFTITNNRPVYNPSASVHFQWDVSETNELTARILMQAGLSMKDTVSIQYANNEITKE